MRKQPGEIVRLSVEGIPTYVISYDEDGFHVLWQPVQRFKRVKTVDTLAEAWRFVRHRVDQKLDPGPRLPAPGWAIRASSGRSKVIR